MATATRRSRTSARKSPKASASQGASRAVARKTKKASAPKAPRGKLKTAANGRRKRASSPSVPSTMSRVGRKSAGKIKKVIRKGIAELSKVGT